MPTENLPLIVLAIGDDERRARFAYALCAAGFHVIGAYDPLTWRTSAPHATPAAMVMEVEDSSTTGWYAVQTAHTPDTMRDIPLVVLVGDTGALTRARARREGCAAVCLNTCPPDVLVHGLRAVLQQTAATPGGRQ
jgi:DNA-binding NarL/FixJ family response regulator